MFFYSKLLTFVPGYFVIIGSGVVDAVANANEVQGIDTDTDNTVSTVHKAEANRGLRTVVMVRHLSLDKKCAYHVSFFFLTIIFIHYHTVARNLPQYEITSCDIHHTILLQ